MGDRMAINHASFIIYSVLSNILFGVCVFTLAVICLFRKSRFLKNTFPSVNMMILFGCILNHFAVILNGLELNETRTEQSQLTNVSHFMCKIRVWCLALGFTFCLGGLLVKIVAASCTHCIQSKGAGILMMCLMLGLLGVDLSALTAWEMLDPLEANFKTLNCTSQICIALLQSPQTNEYVIEQCTSTHLFLGMSYALISWKLLLLVIATALSLRLILTASDVLLPVDIPECTGSVLAVIPFLLGGVIGAKLTTHLPSLHYGFVGGSLILCTAVVVVIMFRSTIAFALRKKRIAPQPHNEAVVEMEQLPTPPSSPPPKIKVETPPPPEKPPPPVKIQNLKEVRKRLLSAQKTREETKLKDALKVAKEAQNKELQKDIAVTENVLLGIYSVRSLREAMNHKELQEIGNALTNIKQGGWEHDYKHDVTSAEQMVIELQAVIESLREAISDRKLPPLENALMEIKNLGIEHLCQEEVEEGKQLLERLRKISKLRIDIKNIPGPKYAEIKAYKNPPRVVIEIMKATYLILGKQEKELEHWKEIQAFLAKIGSDSLRKLTVNLEPSEIDIGTTDYVQEMYISQLDIDAIKSVSEVAETFYLWCVVMMEESRKYHTDKKKREDKQIRG